MTATFLERIGGGGTLLADGAFGSLLMARGLEPGAAPEGLNLSAAHVVEEVARLYLEAGAEIVQTNTFGASPLKLARHGLAAGAAGINAAAVAAVRRAVGRRAYVSGSCGPSGRLLKPYGDVGEEEMGDSFREQMAALAAAGVDLICVETMTDLREARLAVAAARSAAPGVPVMATLTFDATPRGFFTVMGATIAAACAGLADAGADLVGSNCGNGSARMIEIAAEFKRHSRLPVVIQSNAGLPELRRGAAVYPETPADLAQAARGLKALGVAVIGGCCGTTPEHTRAMRWALDEEA